MKKILIVIFSLLSLTAFAQQKKVAVYVTGEDAGINKVLGSKLVSAIARSNEYSAIERTESFLAELSKEQNYQRTGAVDDSELSRLGKQFGVQYICVAAVSDAFNEKYLSARLIDVETAQVERTASSSGVIQSLDGIVSAANSVSNELLTSLGKERQSNLKKVAVYVVKNEAGRNIGRVLGDKLVAGFTNSGRYIAIERTNSFLAQLSKEQNYQHSGAVDDSDLSRLGKQFGVQYVCVADVSDVFGEKYISARLIDVETAEVVNTHDAGGEMNSMSSCLRMANDIASNLSKGTFAEQAEDARLAQIRAEKQKELEEERKKTEELTQLREETSKPHDYTETAYDINMKMIWVEGGEFMMGCTSEQGGNCKDDEKNVRRVTVDGFYIGMLEVTQSQWEKVMGTSIIEQGKKDWRYKYKEHKERGVGDNYPMYFVSWEEAMEFCKKMSEKSGKTYTLPTEAQWEYAARGGKNANSTQYAGSNYPSVVAWYGNEKGTTQLCGTKQANSLGIYDMSGNVDEWCKDWYSDSYLSYDTKNPEGPSSGNDFHVVRGGNWHYGAYDCRVSARSRSVTWNRLNYLCFRVVCLP